MAKANHTSTNNSLIVHPVLSGEVHVDRALWLLTSILAEIAEQSIQSKNDGRTNREANGGENEKSFPLIEGASNV